MTKNAETTLDIQLEDLPGYLLRIVSTRALSELGHILERHGLRVVDATILVHIDEQPGCMQRDVGDRFNIVSANLTPLISKLEARGLVKRKPIDGRSNGIHLTQKGRALKAKAWKEMLKFEENLMSKVPAKLRTPFLQALQSLAESRSASSDGPNYGIANGK